MKNTTGNLFLIGLMGAGKTTLGKLLAQKLNRNFYDSDQVICERTGVSIPTIFELEGETGFRDRETTIINELTQQQNIILATGGGAVIRPENRCFLHERGTVIYLHTQPDILLARTRHDTNRPLLRVENPLVKLQELYDARDSLYRETAHLIMESGRMSSQKAALKLLNLIQQD